LIVVAKRFAVFVSMVPQPGPLPKEKMGSVAEAGVEHIANSSENTEGEQQRAAFLRAFPAANDAELAELLNRWPFLPEAVRRDILMSVRRFAAKMPPGDTSQ
jgi:hypothetical protein